MKPEEALQSCQEVLRALTVSFALASGLDKAKLSSALQAWGEKANISPAARAMLMDLAEGLAVMASGQIPKN